MELTCCLQEKDKPDEDPGEDPDDKVPSLGGGEGKVVDEESGSLKNPKSIGKDVIDLSDADAPAIGENLTVSSPNVGIELVEDGVNVWEKVKELVGPVELDEDVKAEIEELVAAGGVAAGSEDDPIDVEIYC